MIIQKSLMIYHWWSISLYDFYNTIIYLIFIKAEDAARREKNLEEAKKVIIKEDPSLPKAVIVNSEILYKKKYSFIFIFFIFYSVR